MVQSERPGQEGPRQKAGPKSTPIRIPGSPLPPPPRAGGLLRLVEFFGLLRKSVGHGCGPSLPVHKIISLSHRLLSERGEVLGSHVAAEILSSYLSLNAPARAVFFDSLVKEFSPAPSQVGQAADAYCKEPSTDNLARLVRVVEPRRQELFRRLNMASGGTRVLVDMRAQLLEDLRSRPHWKSIEADLEHLLTSWFNRGFLVLRRIDWHTSASILEKLIYYEAVHQIQGWEDLRRRLEADRRCYAFFHPALPEEPIIFIEVALTCGISDKVQPLLDPSKRTRDALRHKRSNGERVGNIEFGYRVSSDQRHLEPDPTEQAALAEIRSLRRQGHTLRGIAMILNRHGHRTRHDTEWRLESVARVVKQHAQPPHAKIA